MELQIACNCGWFWFCIAWGVVLFTTLIMGMQGRNFFTSDGVVRQFSIMDLEMAATPLEIKNIIEGIYALPAGQSKKTLSALKGQLYIDFLFMPAIYGSVFLLCMKVSCNMTYYGKHFFAVLAWLQLLPWLCDIIENIYLLGKIKPEPEASSEKVHTAYQRLEIIKWGLSLMAGVCAIAAIAFFWLSGNYAVHSLYYLLVFIGEIVLFLIAGKFLLRKKLPDPTV